MAVVLDALASCVQNMLTKMVKDEVARMLGVTDEINMLSTKLKFLKSFLADADKRNITEEVVEMSVKELRDAMYEATDIMDLLELKGMKGSQLETGRMKSFAFSIQKPLFAHKISSLIKNLNKKLDHATACSASYNFKNLSTDDMKRHGASSSLAGRQTSGNIVMSDVVGDKIEEDTENLVEMLIKEEEENKHDDNKIKIFAIVGVGGIGKTTLAKKVFNNNSIQVEFTKKIWLSVNRDFTQEDLLSRVILEAGGDHKEASKSNTVNLLEGALIASLKGHKTLLVMDNVWDNEAWNMLQNPLKSSLGCGTGIRVLVTTRLDAVAKEMKANTPYFHVDKLKPEDSWSLLRMQVVGNENGESGIDELKDTIGMRIIEKCDYLPLAVKVMGGILGQKNISESVWQNLLDDFTRSVPKLPEELNNAVYLSYQDLHPSLKQCFLHYSLLPKWMDVHVDSIVAMWISEGFVIVDDDSSKLEELGREYYNELISRNLIEPNTEHLNQTVCSMHDVVRMFGQHVARGEALVAHIGGMCTCEPMSQKLRQLCLVTIGFEPNDELLAWRILQAQRSLRTLVIVGPIKINPGDSWGIFSSLRILDLSLLHLSLGNSANSDELVESVYQLKLLRYLSMERCGISMLPKKIGKMKLLQYINIGQNESLVELPPGIADLRQLRSIDLRGTGIINGVQKLFHGLKYLRMLEGFPAYMGDDDKCSLEELRDLDLLMVLAIDGLVNVKKSSFAKEASLWKKGCLVRLLLSCKSKIEGDDDLPKGHEIEEVFDELSPPRCLEELVIEDYFGSRLPRWMMMSTPELLPLRNLKTLVIHNLYHCTELPDGLCQLPVLELLQITKAPCIKWVRPAFINPTSLNRHNNLHVEKSAFPRLHKLNLVKMLNWVNWEWDQQVKAMPNIEVLSIVSCKLRRLPPGLAFQARALRELYVHDVENLSSLEDFVSVNYLEVHRNPLLKRIGNLPKLQELIITNCPKMNMLDGVPKLQRLSLEDDSMQTLPSYLKDVRPRHLLLDCSVLLLYSIVKGSRTEWPKLDHIQHINANASYAKSGGDSMKLYASYKRNPWKFDTNIRLCDHHYHAQVEHHVNIRNDEGSNQVVPVGRPPVGLQHLRRYTRHFSLAGIGTMQGALFILLLAASLHWMLLLQKIHEPREQ